METDFFSSLFLSGIRTCAENRSQIFPSGDKLPIIPNWLLSKLYGGIKQSVEHLPFDCSLRDRSLLSVAVTYRFCQSQLLRISLMKPSFRLPAMHSFVASNLPSVDIEVYVGIPVFRRWGEMRNRIVASLVAVFVAANVATASPYLQWTGAMSSSHSSNLSVYPAQNVFDSNFNDGRGDWSFEVGSAQGAAGFSLRDDFHGTWHSSNNASLKQSPSGTMAREWLAADFSEVVPIYGADIWNVNWSTISATRAVKSISIDVSADNVNWTTVWTGDLAKAPGIRPHLMYDGVTYVNPSLSPGHAPQFGLLATDSLDFGGSVNARYVVINMQSNHGGDPYFCLEEIRFLTVPEPATATMLLSVLLLSTIGVSRRRFS